MRNMPLILSLILNLILGLMLVAQSQIHPSHISIPASPEIQEPLPSETYTQTMAKIQNLTREPVEDFKDLMDTRIYLERVRLSTDRNSSHLTDSEYEEIQDRLQDEIQILQDEFQKTWSLVFVDVLPSALSQMFSSEMDLEDEMDQAMADLGISEDQNAVWDKMIQDLETEFQVSDLTLFESPF